MLLTKEQKWGAIEAIGWGTKTTDCDKASEDLRLLFNEDQINELEDFCHAMVEQVQRALHKNWMAGDLKGQRDFISDDGFHDLCCHIVGMGYKVFEKTMQTQQPPYGVEAAENFMYIFLPVE
jgi:Protein of unknown function (DUF4240)